MAIEHSTLSTGDLHEPKGIASATSNQVYVANGSGSGAWSVPYITGIEDYNDLSSPAITPSAGVAEKVLNDGNGPFTNKTYKIPTYPDIWDTSTNQFNFSHLDLGDSVDIRFDFDVTISSANDDVGIVFKAGVGGSPYDLLVERREWRYAGTFQFTAWYSVYMGDTNTLNNPAEVWILCDTDMDSVSLNGWYVRTNKRTPEYI